ncbi:MAG: hypothetical protein IPN29_10770 [Saprospiraceae bacterium]|nr:hypothetical protein [Saprospiraceae bacterium]
MHNLSPEKWKNLSPEFDFKKILGRIEDVSAFENAELIYYDAFAPQIQPELWKKEMMQKMYEMLVPGGILVTYCAQGAFKRTLKEVGFQIEAHPGPGRKREITLARKPYSQFYQIDVKNDPYNSGKRIINKI